MEQNIEFENTNDNKLDNGNDNNKRDDIHSNTNSLTALFILCMFIIMLFAGIICYIISVQNADYSVQEKTVIIKPYDDYDWQISGFMYNGHEYIGNNNYFIHSASCKCQYNKK